MTKLTNEQKDKIKAFLAEESDAGLSVEDINDSTLLRDDLDMDSMQAVSLMLELEDWLDIDVEGDDIANAASVGALYTVIDEKLAALEKDKTPEVID